MPEVYHRPVQDSILWESQSSPSHLDEKRAETVEVNPRSWKSPCGELAIRNQKLGGHFGKRAYFKAMADQGSAPPIADLGELRGQWEGPPSQGDEADLQNVRARQLNSRDQLR